MTAQLHMHAHQLELLMRKQMQLPKDGKGQPGNVPKNCIESFLCLKTKLPRRKVAIAARASLRLPAAADTHTDSGSGQKVHHGNRTRGGCGGKATNKESKLKYFMLFKILHQSYHY